MPADLRLIRVKGLREKASALTGESIAVDKQTDPLAEDSELGDRVSMADKALVLGEIALTLFGCKSADRDQLSLSASSNGPTILLI